MPGEKTEKATPKRRKEERKKGNVLISREVTVIFTLLTIFFALRTLMPGIYMRLQANTIHYFTMGAETDTVTQATLANFFLNACILFALTALPLLLVNVAADVFITMGQTRMLFSSEALQFKWDRLSLISGIKRLFSMRSIVELLKAAMKITILGYIIYLEFRDAVLVLPRLMDMTVVAVAAFTGDLILSIVWRAGFVFVILAVADYFYQWWEYERKLRMSKQEVKDEYKETEGDPQTRSRQRSRQMEAARRRMMAAVPTADVVIRNPTHYAVALKYDPETNHAPVVVAKGLDYLALRIVQLAREHEVYIMENKPLARSLFEEVDLDREIPETYYQAIAEVFAFVYNLKERDKEIL
ncbi:MAG: flagellar biosynthesis protein FlhB [Clostridiales bacterium]|nr:flagellar biosynthesis protein FlhB [Clostridiales bacterium]